MMMGLHTTTGEMISIGGHTDSESGNDYNLIVRERHNDYLVRHSVNFHCNYKTFTTEYRARRTVFFL